MKREAFVISAGQTSPSFEASSQVHYSLLKMACIQSLEGSVAVYGIGLMDYCQPGSRRSKIMRIFAGACELRTGKKWLVSAFLIFILAMPASAGSWVVGKQGIIWSTNVLGNGANAQGGVPPYFLTMPPDTASNFSVSRWRTISASELPDAKTQLQGGSEAKARFDCNVTGQGTFDPILFPYQNNVGHAHTFAGNTQAHLNPTLVDYAWLRANGSAACYGGKLNRTAYWEPTVNDTVDGKVLAIKPKNFVTYYVCGEIDPTAAGHNNPSSCNIWPRKLDFIGGYFMQDPGSTTYAAQVAASAGYSAENADKISWKCANSNGSTIDSPLAGQAKQPYLRNPNGTATLDCPLGDPLMVEMNSRPCWDGKNSTAPDGRSHMASYARKGANGKLYCPDGWYHVMGFIVTVSFEHKGKADYKEWFLSSDRMNPPETPPNPRSPSLCRQASAYYCNGETFHFDLIPAWDYGTTTAPGAFMRFANTCLGIRVDFGGAVLPAATPRECGYAATGPYERLLVEGASPDGSLPSPVVNLDQNRSGPNQYFPPNTGNTNPLTHTKHN